MGRHRPALGRLQTCAASSHNYAPYIKQRVNQGGWTRTMDDVAMAPYLTNPDIAGLNVPGFITYDDESTTATKTIYVMKNRGFGGMFMWELSADYDGGSQDPAGRDVQRVEGRAVGWLSGTCFLCSRKIFRPRAD